MRSLQGRSLCTLFLLAMLLVPCLAYSQEAKQEDKKEMPIHLVVGKSKVIRVPFSIRQILLSDPKVVDITLLSPRQISLHGKGVGETSLLVQGKNNRKDQQISMELFVESDLALLKEKLHLLLPDEPIEVYSLKDGLLLKGEVSSSILLSAVLSIVEPFAPGKVISLVQVGGGRKCS